MKNKIIKRDGRIVEFELKKITDAIDKANLVTKEFDSSITKLIVSHIDRDIEGLRLTVELIQDAVEKKLMKFGYYKTAKAYIIYRYQHEKNRIIENSFDCDKVDKYLNIEDWRVHENSNVGFSLQGLNTYIFSEISKIYWLNKIYSPEVRKAHIDGNFHIHDLSLLSVYCVGWSLMDLLMRGFAGVLDKIESAPAKHLRSALGQTVNFFYTLQGESAGAQAFSDFDTLLAPFIRYDNLSYSEVKQLMQEFMFNMNIPTRVGFQTPFTNITLNFKIPEYLKDTNVMIGGILKKEKYKEFQKEINIFNKAFFEVMIEGDAKGKIFTFPIPTCNIDKDFDWDDPELDGLWEVTAKYGIFYFANFINSDMSSEDARSMCCRLRIDNRELRKRGGGLFGASPLTGSIGVVTINMPKLAHEAKNEDLFLYNLERLMDLAKQSLENKRKILENFIDRGLYPYTSYYLSEVKERYGQYWKNHFSTIGLVGMNEACVNLFGKELGDKDSIKFTLKVLDFMRKKLIEYQSETGNNYNLEATPAEGTSYRLAKIDSKRYPSIYCANNVDKFNKDFEPFYTNSSHLPVDFTDDIFEVLKLQDEIQTKYTGGTTLHFYIGEKIKNPSIVKKLVKLICTKYKLPYFTITPVFSICSKCGYLSGIHYDCPDCNKKCEVYSRIVGYLRPVSQWNKGKISEFKKRKGFKI